MLKEKISIKHYQEIDFNEDYINNSLKKLNNVKTTIKNITNQSNKLEDEIKEYFNNINKCFPNLLKEIESCISWFSNTTSFNDKKNKNIKRHETFIENIYQKFQKCNNYIKKINENNSLDKINELNKNLKNIINDTYNLKFYPSKCGNINFGKSIIDIALSNMETSESDDPFTFEDVNINSKDIFSGYLENENEYGNENGSENCNLLKLDEEMDNIPKQNISNNNKTIIKIELKNEYKEDDEVKNDGINFLKCTECTTNKAINKCSHCNKYFCQGCSDFILKYEQLTNHILKKIPDSELDRETSKDLFLKNFIEFIKYYLLKINNLLNLESFNFNFPSLENISNFESQKIYLEQINKISLNNENGNEEEKDIKINANLINSLERIFKNKKLHISNDFYDIDDDFYSDEKYDKNDAEFDLIKNNLLYFITVVTKERYNINEKIITTIIDKISSSLNIEKDSIIILINDKVNNYVKSRNYAELSYNQLQYENPIFNQLKEVKLLTDHLLCNECKIPKNYFNCKGNCLNPNLSCNLIRGTEVYEPPYGWIGIGLNVEGKYDNGNDDWLNNNSNLSEWAIAYHGISPKISSDLIKKLLNNIITKNGIKKGISKMKCKSNDIRHWGKVGVGIYLSSNIKTAEHYTGIISFNNKKYKVLLMAKVFIKGIREPEYSNFWVLDEKYIRIYRVLFKEIN